MRIFNKRLAVIVSDQHMSPHGGIGQFVKGICELSNRNNWMVDVFLDKLSKSNSIIEFLKKQDNVKLYCEDKNFMSYKPHTDTFMYGDTINLEKVMNLKGSFTRGLQSHVYDLILVNTPEGVFTPYFLSLYNFIPIVYYTHNQNLIFGDLPEDSVWKDSFNKFVKHFMTIPKLIIGTQSEFNVEKINEWCTANAVSLPMPIPEQSLLNESNADKSGVLFIGRYEDRKNPELFAKVIKETGFPAKVMTGGKNAYQKWETLFKKYGIEDYDIRVQINGNEKVNFIKSAKVAFHPAKLESYGFSAFETLHSCPTVCLEEYKWYKNFEHLNIIAVKRKQVVEKIKELYAQDSNEWERNQLPVCREWNLKINDIWSEFLNKQLDVGHVFKQNVLMDTLESTDYITVNDFYFKTLNRSAISVEDMEMIYKRRSIINVFHTVDDSYLTLGEDISIPDDRGIFDELFE